MPTPAKTVAILTALPGKAAALEELLVTMAPDCRAEPGNLRWDIWQDPAEPGRFVLDELYHDEAAVAAHRETPHFQHYRGQIGNLAERVAVTIRPLDIAE
jgi:quinol monooxygenase YgiN